MLSVYFPIQSLEMHVLYVKENLKGNKFRSSWKSKYTFVSILLCSNQRIKPRYYFQSLTQINFLPVS
jgi:hypothetical protein